MSQIRIDLTEPLLNGMDIKFQAPCDCTKVTGLVIYYPAGEDVTEHKAFVLKDAHGSVLTGIGNLFVKDALVKVLVDTVNGVAYLQNADTNSYLEYRLNNLANALNSLADVSGLTLVSEVGA